MYTLAVVYGKCMLEQNQIVFNGLKVNIMSKFVLLSSLQTFKMHIKQDQNVTY